MEQNEQATEEATAFSTIIRDLIDSLSPDAAALRDIVDGFSNVQICDIVAHVSRLYGVVTRSDTERIKLHLQNPLNPRLALDSQFQECIDDWRLLDYHHSGMSTSVQFAIIVRISLVYPELKDLANDYLKTHKEPSSQVASDFCHHLVQMSSAIFLTGTMFVGALSTQSY
jgi:hypothetical protein